MLLLEETGCKFLLLPGGDGVLMLGRDLALWGEGSVFENRLSRGSGIFLKTEKGKELIKEEEYA